MTAKEIQKRNIKAESLKVLQSEDGKFFVESEKGTLCIGWLRGWFDWCLLYSGKKRSILRIPVYVFTLSYPDFYFSCGEYCGE